MEYQKIVDAVSSIFDDTRYMFYKPLDTRIEDMFFMAKNYHLNGAKQYKTQKPINGVDIIILKNIDMSCNKIDQYYDMLYLDDNISFVIFADNLLASKENIIDLFNPIFDMLTKFNSIIMQKLGIKRDVSDMYSTINLMGSTVMAIKCMQNIVIDFSQNDITQTIKRFEDLGAKEEFKEFIDLCFSESIEVLLEKGLIYEPTLKLYNKLIKDKSVKQP